MKLKKLCIFATKVECNSRSVQFKYNKMITRLLDSEIRRLANLFPVVIVNGPRQSGKTTLCKMAFEQFEYINLENIATRGMVASDPLNYLKQHSSGLVIDEAQRLPELFSYIQVLVDEDKSRRYILTGSSNFALLGNVGQSLAGRAAILTLLPFAIEEMPNAMEQTTNTLMLKGGYPAVWCNGQSPQDVYSNYYTTYVERDLLQLVNIHNLSQFQQFVRLSAGRVSCEFNASEFANELGCDLKTIQHWNSILETSYITFMLPPYYRNIGKRIIKTPKRYFYDTGLICFLLGIENEQQLETHPLRGAIFENMVVAEMVKRKYHHGRRPNFYFYRDKSQKEVDLIEEETFEQLRAYEIKSAQSFHPQFTKGLEYFHGLYGEKVISTTVLYDGNEALTTDYNGYRNYRSL